MSRIGRLWAGKIFGTNTGNVFAEFTNAEDGVHGEVRVMDDRFGPVVYRVTGTFDGTSLTVSGDAVHAPEGSETGTVTASAELSPEGHLTGRWSSTLGTGGTLHLFPHDVPSQGQAAPGSLPEQLHTATRSLGALRLYKDDVRGLIELLKRDFGIGRIVVTYPNRGSDVSKYVPDFEAEVPGLGELRYLKLNIQEPEAYGINRVATVVLNANGANEVQVQGIQESWVVGKAESVAAYLRHREKPLATTFRKFGLTVPALLVLAILVFLPELTLERRFIFVAFVVGASWAIGRLHARYIPNALVLPATDKPGPVGGVWPQALSWLLAVSGALVSAVVYGLLKGELPLLNSWLSAIL